MKMLKIQNYNNLFAVWNFPCVSEHTQHVEGLGAVCDFRQG